MRYVLTRKSEEAVRRFLASPVLLAFDFDGPLAPFVGDPDRARLRPATRRLLRRVAEAWPCVVISGRSRADVRNKLFGTGIRRTFGNHGAEPWADAREARKQGLQGGVAHRCRGYRRNSCGIRREERRDRRNKLRNRLRAGAHRSPRISRI